MGQNFYKTAKRISFDSQILSENTASARQNLLPTKKIFEVALVFLRISEIESTFSESDFVWAQVHTYLPIRNAMPPGML